MHVLIAYGTRHGHTGVVAERIATFLRESGDDVDVHELRARGAWPDPSSYDARDFVLTDWDAVDDFARRFAARTTAKA